MRLLNSTVFLSILKRNKCILIKYSPYIEWKDKDEFQETTEKTEIQIANVPTQSNDEIVYITPSMDIKKIGHVMDEDFSFDEEEP